MSRARIHFAIAIVLSTGFAGNARAQSEREIVQLDYHGVAGCPAEQAFSDEVRARTRKADFSRRADGRRFVVTLSRAADRIDGQLEIVDAHGQSSERRIDGEDCAEVVSALALAGALAIDPEASTLPRAELAAIDATPPPVPPPKPVPVEPRPRVRAATASGRLGLRLGVSLAAVRGPAPELLFAAGPSIEGVRAGASGWSPAARITLLAAQTGIVGPEAELATFRWAVARLELCPHRPELMNGVRLRPCVVSDAGVLYGRGDAAEEPGSATRGTFATGLSLGGEFDVNERFSLGFSFTETLNLTRDDFVFLESPKRRVHQVPLTSQSLVLGASFRLL